MNKLLITLAGALRLGAALPVFAGPDWQIIEKARKEKQAAQLAQHMTMVPAPKARHTRTACAPNATRRRSRHARGQGSESVAPTTDPIRYGACHTAEVSGYAIEGHVPAREIHRLLKDRPTAVGLAVPAMPRGSPGMDGSAYVGARDPYDVLLVQRDGSSRVYQSYRRQEIAKTATLYSFPIATVR